MGEETLSTPETKPVSSLKKKLGKTSGMALIVFTATAVAGSGAGFYYFILMPGNKPVQPAFAAASIRPQTPIASPAGNPQSPAQRSSSPSAAEDNKETGKIIEKDPFKAEFLEAFSKSKSAADIEKAKQKTAPVPGGEDFKRTDSSIPASAFSGKMANNVEAELRKLKEGSAGKGMHLAAAPQSLGLQVSVTGVFFINNTPVAITDKGELKEGSKMGEWIVSSVSNRGLTFEHESTGEKRQVVITAKRGAQ